MTTRKDSFTDQMQTFGVRFFLTSADENFAGGKQNAQVEIQL